MAEVASRRRDVRNFIFGMIVLCEVRGNRGRLVKRLRGGKLGEWKLKAGGRRLGNCSELKERKIHV
jgi:hypothetical protein